MSANGWFAPITPSQAKLIKAEPRSVMKRRSPRVVSILKTPIRGASGNLIPKIVNTVKMLAIMIKNVAVGHVHAIHSMLYSFLNTRLHAAQSKALGDVVANKIDYQRARNDC
jgi:hypothetical protein